MFYLSFLIICLTFLQRLTSHRFLTSRIFLNITRYLLFYCYASFLQILMDTVLKSLLLHKKVAAISIFNAVLRTSLYIIFLESLDVSHLLSIEILLAFIFLVQGLFIYKKFTANFDTSIIPAVKKPVTF